MVPALYIPFPWLIYLVVWTLCFWPSSPILPMFHPCPWQPPICSLYLWIQFFFFKIPHVSEIIWYYLSLTFFTFPLGPSMLLQMVGLPSFSWLSNTPLYIHITALLIYLRVGSSPGGMLSSAPPTMPRGSLAACPLPPHSQVSSFIKNIRLTYEGCGMVVTNGTASSEPAADAVLLSYVSDHWNHFA